MTSQEPVQVRNAPPDGDGAGTLDASSVWTDERAIEGLPVRLVIAVVVGIAALGLMLGMLEGLDDFGETEVTVTMEDELLTLDGGGDAVTIGVVTEDGQRVEDAQILVTEGSLPLANGPVDLQTGPDSHEVTLSVGTSAAADAQVSFRPGQRRGTLELEVIPPSGSDLADDTRNPDLVVIAG